MTTFYDSLWSKTAIAPPECPAINGPVESDVVIVGAGYTGLSAAIHLARAGRQVTVLEAAEPGFGCSGRNGGQVNPGSTRMLPTEVIDTLGSHWGERFVEFGDRSCDLVFELIERYQIDCEAKRPGYVQGGYGSRGEKINRGWVREWSERGTDVELLSAGQVHQLIGAQGYTSGFIDSRGGNVQPLSYSRGLAHAAIKEGASIHGQSEVTSIERNSAQWRVSTANASVDCKVVILATNAHTDSLWPGLAQSIVPTASFLCATEPLTESVLAELLPGHHAVSESARVLSYYRRDDAGRFVIGGVGNLTHTRESGDRAHVKAAAVRLFPQLADVKWEYEWGGWPAITKNHTPHLFKLDQNAYAGLGFNGRGVASATLMGSQLASLVLDDAEPLIQVKSLNGFAMHQFRQVGVSFHLVTRQLLDRLDRRGAA